MWINSPRPYVYGQTQYLSLSEFPGPGPGHYNVSNYKPHTRSPPKFTIQSRTTLLDGELACASRCGEPMHDDMACLAALPKQGPGPTDTAPPLQVSRVGADWVSDGVVHPAHCGWCADMLCWHAGARGVSVFRGAVPQRQPPRPHRGCATCGATVATRCQLRWQRRQRQPTASSVRVAVAVAVRVCCVAVRQFRDTADPTST